jgi:dihydropteroate synthase
VFLTCGTKSLDLTRPVVMGVVNVTPDSFSDGGRFLSRDAAIAHALRLEEEGAQILDIGGESTRPGAAPVGVEDELRRVIPVVEGLAGRSRAVLSIDTSKPEVMRAAAAAGAGLINDVRALREPGGLQAAAASGCAVCVMHMQGDPGTMQREPTYRDVVSDVSSFLEERARECEQAGIATDRIVVDPGFGFGKTVAHNLELLRRLRELSPSGRPLLAGLSRKSMLKSILGRETGERVHGSVALAVMAVIHGARIVRAHDVAATVDAIRTVLAVRGEPFDGDA